MTIFVHLSPETCIMEGTPIIMRPAENFCSMLIDIHTEFTKITEVNLSAFIYRLFHEN